MPLAITAIDIPEAVLGFELDVVGVFLRAASIARDCAVLVSRLVDGHTCFSAWVISAFALKCAVPSRCGSIFKAFSR